MLRVKTVTSWNKKMSGVSITCLRVRVVCGVQSASCVVGGPWCVLAPGWVWASARGERVFGAVPRRLTNVTKAFWGIRDGPFVRRQPVLTSVSHPKLVLSLWHNF